MPSVIKMFMVTLILCTAVWAQDTSLIVVKKSDLPAGLVEQLSVKDQLQTYGKWAGMGKEIGTAMREGLGALNDEVNRFADTKVGAFVMFIIAFKVLGYPIIQFCVGFPLMIFGTIFFGIWFKKTCLPRRVLVSKEVQETDKRPITTYKYETHNPLYSDGAEIGGFGIYLFFLAFCAAILFVH